MNRRKAGTWARWVVWGTLIAVAGIGCNPLNLAAFIFARPEKEPAEHPLAFAKDGPKKDKDEVVVVLLPHLAPGTNREFPTADRDLADKLARKLPEMAKENKNKLKLRVINPTDVDKFKIANPNWKQMSPGELGQKLHADFVLDIWLDKMRLYQPNTPEKIYQGAAEVSVFIYEVSETGGDQKDRYVLPFRFPRTGVRLVDSIPESQFKMQFIESLAYDIALQHIDHKQSIGIADGR